MFHNDTYKQRYFVLARVPHATVLIYYGQKCMDEDHILGYIDLRRCDLLFFSSVVSNAVRLHARLAHSVAGNCCCVL